MYEWPFFHTLSSTQLFLLLICKWNYFSWTCQRKVWLKLFPWLHNLKAPDFVALTQRSKCGNIFWPPVLVFIPQFYLYCDFPLPCLTVLLNWILLSVAPPLPNSYHHPRLMHLNTFLPSLLLTSQEFKLFPILTLYGPSWRSPSLKWRVIFDFTLPCISRTQSTIDMSWFHLQVESVLFLLFLLLS